VRVTRILTISGSLRRHSSNSEVLRALSIVAPTDVGIVPYEDLATLPFFNPDLDEEGMMAPPPVRDFRRQVGEADALFICSPEYAHGVPGVLKNALDWLVSAPEIIFKPIGLLNASPRSTHAQASLAETLRTMSTRIVSDASVMLPLSGRRLDARGIVADSQLADMLRTAIDALVRAVKNPSP